MASAAAIAPNLTVFKPRRQDVQQTPSNATRRSKRKPTMKPIKEVEVLQFEWKDLPPIDKLKGAIVRRKVSEGISYMLPVDKGKISINNQFRTDLRFMFQEPYADELTNYDERKVRATARIHFTPNSQQTRVTRRQIEKSNVELNSESEKVYKDFSKTVPRTGGHGSRVNVESEKTEKRSSLFIPVKAFVPPEAQKMKDEAQRILDSVDEEQRNKLENKDNGTVTKTEAKRRQSKHAICKKRANSSTPSGGNRSRTSSRFQSYNELKSSPTPSIPALPEVLQRSVHITPSRAKEIWDWLHDGEALSEFEYFLSICG